MNTASPVNSVPVARVAPAYFIGTQEGLPAFSGFRAVNGELVFVVREAIPSIDLYNLTAPLGDAHPAGSTVSAQTLIAHGFTLPPKSGAL